MRHNQLHARLDAARDRGTLRHLLSNQGGFDFCSNDYLGLARDQSLWHGLPTQFGSTGSRLISGNLEQIMELEQVVCERHGAEGALLFNSGYDANLGLFSSLPRDGVSVIYDEHIHASVKDGILLSRATSYPFRHNDLNHLEARLNKSRRSYVAVEALYSMDGQFAPLRELVHLCDRYGAALIVDEAHSGGVYGAAGAGLVSHAGLTDYVFARVVTYGKAFGCAGACVLGPQFLKNYLINFAHSFVYSTALPLPVVQRILWAYRVISVDDLSRRLAVNIELFLQELRRNDVGHLFIPSRSAIQAMVLPGARAESAARSLQEKGYNLKAIRSPTVKRGTERLRICLHAFNSPLSIANLVQELVRLP